MKKAMELHRYWFKFDLTMQDPHPLGILLGCGLTAWQVEDARRLLSERVFGAQRLPKVVSVLEDVDIASLDQRHVLPNMGDPSRRGV